MSVVNPINNRTSNMHSMVCRRGRGAFTLVELLVVIAIIGILVGLLLPAMQNMRELSRRSSCQQNLAKLSLALSSYNDRYGQFPAGTINADGPIKSQEAGGYHHNWLIGLMPMLDANVVADAVDSSVSVYDDANACLLYTSPSPRDLSTSRMPSSA